MFFHAGLLPFLSLFNTVPIWFVLLVDRKSSFHKIFLSCSLCSDFTKKLSSTDRDGLIWKMLCSEFEENLKRAYS